MPVAPSKPIRWILFVPRSVKKTSPWAFTADLPRPHIPPPLAAIPRWAGAARRVRRFSTRPSSPVAANLSDPAHGVGDNGGGMFSGMAAVAPDVNHLAGVENRNRCRPWKSDGAWSKVYVLLVILCGQTHRDREPSHRAVGRERIRKHSAPSWAEQLFPANSQVRASAAFAARPWSARGVLRPWPDRRLRL